MMVLGWAEGLATVNTYSAVSAPKSPYQAEVSEGHQSLNQVLPRRYAQSKNVSNQFGQSRPGAAHAHETC